MAPPKDKWSRWHPIARSIAQKLVQRDDPDLTDDELVEIKTNLTQIFDRNALEIAVRDLLLLAAALEHEGRAHIAEKLFALVEAKPVIGALDRINHVRAIDRAELVSSNAKRFAAFSKHDDAPRRAPDRKDSQARGLRPRDFKAMRIVG